MSRASSRITEKFMIKQHAFLNVPVDGGMPDDDLEGSRLQNLVNSTHVPGQAALNLTHRSGFQSFGQSPFRMNESVLNSMGGDGGFGTAGRDGAWDEGEVEEKLIE